MLIIKRIVLVNLSLLCSLYLVSCAQRSLLRSTDDIDNKDSVLLDYLVERRDFNNRWIWVNEFTQQETKDLSLDNSGLLDVATRGIEGYYGEVENLLEVWHTLYCYKTTPPKPSLNYDFAPDYSLYESELDAVGEDFISECRQSNRQVVCESVTRYGNSISEVIVDVPNGLVNETNDIVNNVLLQLDSRLIGLSDCFSD